MVYTEIRQFASEWENWILWIHISAWTCGFYLIFTTTFWSRCILVYCFANEETDEIVCYGPIVGSVILEELRYLLWKCQASTMPGTIQEPRRGLVETCPCSFIFTVCIFNFEFKFKFECLLWVQYYFWSWRIQGQSIQGRPCFYRTYLHGESGTRWRSQYKRKQMNKVV